MKSFLSAGRLSSITCRRRTSAGSGVAVYGVFHRRVGGEAVVRGALTATVAEILSLLLDQIIEDPETEPKGLGCGNQFCIVARVANRFHQDSPQEYHLHRSDSGAPRYPSQTRLAKTSTGCWLAQAWSARGLCSGSAGASEGRRRKTSHSRSGPTAFGPIHRTRPRTRGPDRAPDYGPQGRTDRVRKAHLNAATPAPPSRLGRTVTRNERSDIGCGETPERQARPDRGPARTNGRSDDRGTCRCDGLAETFGPRRSEPAPVSGLRHSSGIDGGTAGLSARTGRGG